MCVEVPGGRREGYNIPSPPPLPSVDTLTVVTLRSHYSLQSDEGEDAREGGCDAPPEITRA